MHTAAVDRIHVLPIAMHTRIVTRNRLRYHRPHPHHSFHIPPHRHTHTHTRIRTPPTSHRHAATATSIRRHTVTLARCNPHHSQTHTPTEHHTRTPAHQYTAILIIRKNSNTDTASHTPLKPHTPKLPHSATALHRYITRCHHYIHQDTHPPPQPHTNTPNLHCKYAPSHLHTAKYTQYYKQFKKVHPRQCKGFFSYGVSIVNKNALFWDVKLVLIFFTVLSKVYGRVP